jgi:hypothetical protein
MRAREQSDQPLLFSCIWSCRCTLLLGPFFFGKQHSESCEFRIIETQAGPSGCPAGKLERRHTALPVLDSQAPHLPQSSKNRYYALWDDYSGPLGLLPSTRNFNTVWLAKMLQARTMSLLDSLNSIGTNQHFSTNELLSYRLHWVGAVQMCSILWIIMPLKLTCLNMLVSFVNDFVEETTFLVLLLLFTICCVGIHNSPSATVWYTSSCYVWLSESFIFCHTGFEVTVEPVDYPWSSCSCLYSRLQSFQVLPTAHQVLLPMVCISINLLETQSLHFAHSGLPILCATELRRAR